MIGRGYQFVVAIVVEVGCRQRDTTGSGDLEVKVTTVVGDIAEVLNAAAISAPGRSAAAGC
jgi:hypothetical protein